MKIKKILISQPKPESEKSPYFDIVKNHKVEIDFKAFIHVEGIPASEFRKQRIDLSQYTCIILNSKNAVDHYFRMANEMRYTVPEKNKYFCLTEAIALYLQKYIVYRKRKIFFAQQGINELVEPIKKNKDEKFLFPCSDKHTDKITEFLDASQINYIKGIFYKTVSSNMKDVNLSSYDMVCFFSPNGIESLFENFPNFKQGDLIIAVFGPTTFASAQSKGLKVYLAAPLPKAPSMAMALDLFLKEANGKNGSVQPMIAVFPKENFVDSVKTSRNQDSKSEKTISRTNKVQNKEKKKVSTVEANVKSSKTPVKNKIVKKTITSNTKTTKSKIAKPKISKATKGKRSLSPTTVKTATKSTKKTTAVKKAKTPVRKAVKKGTNSKPVSTKSTTKKATPGKTLKNKTKAVVKPKKASVVVKKNKVSSKPTTKAAKSTKSKSTVSKKTASRKTTPTKRKITKRK